MKDALIVTLLSVVPRNRGARAMGWFARSAPSRWITRTFVRVYGVDLSEAEGTLSDYPTLEALFTRKLKPGVRPVDPTPGVVVSPVDGRCAAVGRTANGTLPLTPERTLDIANLVGEPLDGEREVAVLYLSPKDYHRVHAACDGTATLWRYLPGTLWPVFPAAVRKVQGLFSRNERLTLAQDTDLGTVFTVLIGAFGVGRITSPLCDCITNTGGQSGEAPLDVHVHRGDEVGTFHLGSTVVLVLPAGSARWTVQPGEPVRMGQAIAEPPRQLAG